MASESVCLVVECGLDSVPACDHFSLCLLGSRIGCGASHRDAEAGSAAGALPHHILVKSGVERQFVANVCSETGEK